MDMSNCFFMDRAFALARKGLNSTTPNPRVGCVIAKNGKIVGEGYHLWPGQSHAEIIAIESAGKNARDSSMFVTLEPCCFRGKTGPCTEEIIKAGIKEVIIASNDPNPRVAGKGIGKLRENGINVVIKENFKKSFELNPGFFKRMKMGLPWVRVKIAKSLDGYIAINSGKSKWITGLEARQDGHRWRARSCCILTGSQTVRHDNPRLTVRTNGNSLRNPVKVIVDPNLIISLDSKIFSEGEIMLATANANNLKKFDKIKTIKDRNIRVLEFPPMQSASNRFSLKLLLAELAKNEFNEVQVEAGPGLVSSLLGEKLIDELLIYQSPKILGNGLSFVNQIDGSELLKKESEWCYTDISIIGNDMRMILRNKENGNFLSP